MAFKYRKRSSETVQKRAAQRGGDFQGFILEEFKMYRPQKGDNWVRILPPTWKDLETYGEHYGMEVFVHYGVGPDKASVLCCAKMPDPETGKTKKCPICAAKAKLEAQGDAEEAKELRVSKRVLVYVLDKKEPEKGPLAWAMPWTVDRDISKVSIDKRTGETYMIDDPERGYDVTFEIEGEKRNTEYTGIQIARKRSAVDEEHLDFVADHPLPDILIYRTPAEIQALFEGSGASGADEDDDDRPKKKARRPDPDDEEEEERPRKKARRPDPDDEDEDEDEEPPRKKASSKPARRPDPDDEDEDEPPRKVKPKAKPRPEPEDDDEEEEEEELPRKKAAGKPKPSSRPKLKEPEDDDDEEEEEPPRRRSRTERELDDEIPFDGGKKRKPKAPEPEDDDEEEEDEDDAKGKSRAASLKKTFGGKR